MKVTVPLIGVPDVSQAQAFDAPRFGWHKLTKYSGHKEAEDAVAHALISLGMFVGRAGDRSQSYDLEILECSSCTQNRECRIHKSKNINPGKYEIKSLWRKNDRSAFDRRFKIGTRGEEMYGRRDASIKSFALQLEKEIDFILEANVKHQNRDFNNLTFVSEAHSFIDSALIRKHSKSFEDRLWRLCTASLGIPAMNYAAATVLNNSIENADIVRSFNGIEGIFIVAGPIFTLVRVDEFARFITFDSASSEGAKLRFKGVIPSEQAKQVTATKKTKVKKGKKK